MNTEDKANLLFQLFPEDVAKFQNYLLLETRIFLKNPETLLLVWKSKFGTLPIWKHLATKSKTILDKHPQNKNTAMAKFRLLFEDYLSDYSVHYLEQYLSQASFTNQRFPIAVHLFFL
jgi:hypothetical protein